MTKNIKQLTIKRLIIFIGLFTCLFSTAQNHKAATFDFSETQTIIKQKNFYLLAAIEKNIEVSQILKNNKTLDSLTQKICSNIEASIKESNQELSKFVGAYILSDKDINTASNELKLLVNKEKVVSDFVNNTLRSSECYINFDNLSNEEFFAKSWELCANGLNYVMNVYGLGEKSNYPKIDSISYDKNSKFFFQSIYSWSNLLYNHSSWQNGVFFKSALDFSLALLYMNHRDEAARYELMELKENKKAYDFIAKINFAKYEYATIVVLGGGPQNYRDNLSSKGKHNLLLGVFEYQEKKAPLIIVSGGHVHPFRTEFAEAIEMKKELINLYGIPEEHIIIEPHARHTTTNFRNVSRLILKYNIPSDKKSLAVSNKFHIKAIVHHRFEQRCLRELGYMPIKLGNRISLDAVEFTPLKISKHQNPLEPLDP